MRKNSPIIHEFCNRENISEIIDQCIYHVYQSKEILEEIERFEENYNNPNFLQKNKRKIYGENSKRVNLVDKLTKKGFYSSSIDILLTLYDSKHTLSFYDKRFNMEIFLNCYYQYIAFHIFKNVIKSLIPKEELAKKFFTNKDDHVKDFIKDLL